ncbi:MAG: ferritin [Anaerolineales bacterium]|nr:ferritin [Anaerolineales bacterium]
MKLSEKMVQGLNEQIGHEFGAKLQYLSIAAYFDSEDLPQLAQFFYQQANEEDMHAMKFVSYLVDNDCPVEIPALDKPKSQFNSAAETADLSLDWEKTVTSQINELVAQAQKDNDNRTQEFLRWFVTEQVEEEATMRTLQRTFQRAGENLLWVEDFLARNPLPQPANNGAA